jgi:carotenoid cleavage dioxygenase
MLHFPDTVHFRGLNRPVRIEAQVHDLEIEGVIPAEIEGAFFRAVPDRAFPPMYADDVILSHDGMVAKLEIKGGRASYAIRYVRTERFVAEQEAGRALFGHYRQPYSDDPAAAGIDRTVANTTPIWHGGRLYMTKEDGRGYEIDPHTLETVGRWDYGGRLRSQTMTAHARVDSVTGELFFFGYEAAGLCSPTIAYGIASPDGDLVSEQWFDAPYCAMMHDFVITERHAVFPVFPTKADLARLKAGGPHWVHDQAGESWLGVMPRYGAVEKMVWIRGPAGVHSYHMMNAFEDGSQIHVDLCLFNTNMIPFIREDSGLEIQPDGGFVRWTIDLADPEAGVVETPLGPPGELPRIRDADQGRPYRYGWYLTIDPKGGGPLGAGPAGISFNALLRVDLGNGVLSGLTLGEGYAINEPVHVPAADPASEGWLLAVVDRKTGESDFHQEVWVLDAADVAKAPVAKIHIPVPGRPQVHGSWVSAAQLAEARISPPARV